MRNIVCKTIRWTHQGDLRFVCNFKSSLLEKATKIERRRLINNNNNYLALSSFIMFIFSIRSIQVNFSVKVTICLKFLVNLFFPLSLVFFCLKKNRRWNKSRSTLHAYRHCLNHRVTFLRLSNDWFQNSVVNWIEFLSTIKKFMVTIKSQRQCIARRITFYSFLMVESEVRQSYYSSNHIRAEF